MKEQYHLMLELRNGCEKQFSSLERIHTFLWVAPAQIGMTRISNPDLLPYEPKEFTERGVTANVFLAESHIAIHTFPEKQKAYLDIYSCKSFDPQHFIDITLKWFKSTSYKFMFVDREKLEVVDKGAMEIIGDIVL